MLHHPTPLIIKRKIKVRYHFTYYIICSRILGAKHLCPNVPLSRHTHLKVPHYWHIFLTFNPCPYFCYNTSLSFLSPNKHSWTTPIRTLNTQKWIYYRENLILRHFKIAAIKILFFLNTWQKVRELFWK